MNMSEYLQGLVADWVSGSAFPAVPGQLKIALSESDPVDDASGFDEVVGGTYARQDITFTAPTTNEANGAVSSNTAAILFTGLPTTTATHAAIFDNAGTNMLWFGPLSAIRAVTAGDTISIPANAVSLALKGRMSKYLGEAVINWLRGTAMPTAPVSLVLEISRADPLRDATGFNPPSAGDAYVAQAMEFTAASFLSGTGTTIKNIDPVVFPAATATWGTITHAAVFTIGGQLLFYGALGSPKTVGVGAGIGFAADSLTLVLR